MYKFTYPKEAILDPVGYFFYFFEMMLSQKEVAAQLEDLQTQYPSDSDVPVADVLALIKSLNNHYDCDYCCPQAESLIKQFLSWLGDYFLDFSWAVHDAPEEGISYPINCYENDDDTPQSEQLTIKEITE